MNKLDLVTNVVLFLFILGYIAIIFEAYIKVNKTASAIITAVVTWGVLFVFKKNFIASSAETINMHIGNASQIIFFLLSAVTLVELIDSHKGFKIFLDFIQTRSKKKILWIIGLLAFFFSAILDNLTTTIVLISVLRKIVIDREDRIILGAAVVIAANAGGAWTPIGDVTTTMLWIKGHLTTLKVMKSLFLPSVFSVLVSLGLLSMRLKGTYPNIVRYKKKQPVEPGAKTVLLGGIAALMFVPIIRYFTGLPPFMSMLIGLGILWVITDIMHHKYEERKHLRIPHILTKIDSAGILFFLGILLCINSLETIGLLKELALVLDKYISNTAFLATLIGLLSSIVDNVPLVAACSGMYSLQVYPVDSVFWHMIAYAAGTGGSILIIGSASGVALMGLEKIDFIWYLRKISLTALAGYLAGMTLYLLLNIF